jgi:hypothetical protein
MLYTWLHFWVKQKEANQGLIELYEVNNEIRTGKRKSEEIFRSIIF